MAPEILNSKPYNHKVDMWSFGVSIYEALLGTTPFGGKDKDDLRNNVNNGIVKFHSHSLLSNNCVDFLSKCLKINPHKRFTVNHALNHPFMNSGSPQYMKHMNIFSKWSTTNQLDVLMLNSNK